MNETARVIILILKRQNDFVKYKDNLIIHFF